MHLLEGCQPSVCKRTFGPYQDVGLAARMDYVPVRMGRQTITDKPLGAKKKTVIVRDVSIRKMGKRQENKVILRENEGRSISSDSQMGDDEEDSKASEVSLLLNS